MKIDKVTDSMKLYHFCPDIRKIDWHPHALYGLNLNNEFYPAFFLKCGEEKVSMKVGIVLEKQFYDDVDNFLGMSFGYVANGKFNLVETINGDIA